MLFKNPLLTTNCYHLLEKQYFVFSVSPFSIYDLLNTINNKINIKIIYNSLQINTITFM